MKLLSIIIPSFNSEDYLSKSIESALVGGEKVEIIIVNDGSTDSTQKIADDYKDKYQSIIKVVNQENKGHGGAINSGLHFVEAEYVKILDSDDALNKESLLQVLDFLETDNTQKIDMIISNYVYDKVGVKNKKVISYEKHLKENEAFSWDDFKFSLGKYLLMHSLIFKSSILIENNLQLPEHTFYVDNIYVFETLLNVNSMIYLNTNLYYYFIGREDQSVNEDIMIERIDQQIKVNKKMYNYFSTHKHEIVNDKLYKYMLGYLEIITLITNILIIKGNTETLNEKQTKLWMYFKEKDNELYRNIRYSTLGKTSSVTSKIGRKAVLLAYEFVQKNFGFN